jgi:membrane protein
MNSGTKFISNIKTFFNDTFNSEKDGILGKITHTVTKLYKKIYDFIDTLDRHNIFMLSAGIAFNIFLYFIPLILIAIYFAVNLVEVKVLDETIETLFLKFLPDTENTFILIYEVLTEITAIQKGSSASGLIGLITLLWISSLFISAIRSGLDRVLEFKGERTFIYYRFKDVLLTLFFPILIIFYSFSVPIFAIATNYFTEIIPFLKNTPLVDWFAELFSFTFSVILFYFIYKFIPSNKTTMKFSFISAFIGGVMVLAARWLFSWYLVAFSNYGAFYGTYAAIVSVAIWVYYFSFILLFSAEISNLILAYKRDKVISGE